MELFNGRLQVVTIFSSIPTAIPCMHIRNLLRRMSTREVVGIRFRVHEHRERFVKRAIRKETL